MLNLPFRASTKPKNVLRWNFPSSTFQTQGKKFFVEIKKCFQLMSKEFLSRLDVGLFCV